MKRLFPLLATGIMASLSIMAGIGAVHAQEKAETRFNGAVTPRRIAMGVGKSVIIDLPQDAAEIFVADPKVANAVVRSPRKLYVIGMDPGQTSVFALDREGRQIAALELSIGRDVGELQQILRAAMPAAAITARTVNDTIILTGAVDSIEDAQRAGDIAKGFVQQASPGGPPSAPGAPPGAPGASSDGRIVNVLTIRGRDQVMLKVTIAEVDRDIAKQLGITSSSLTASWGTFAQVNPFGINGAIAQSALGAITAAGPTGTALTAHNPANTLSATLEAFERYGVTRILAEPTVSAVSGESAKLTVGGEIPIPGPPSCSTGGLCTVTVIYKDYGVSLRFTPIVLAEGRIELHLGTEVTDIDNTQAQVTLAGFPVPAFLTRKNETTVEVPSGGSIASAGLLP
ncbi:MAG TPA: pilus assembly protein N-terminal domain-containing protein, partial [Methylocella sp.]|nr:pilus assembly protein N-terminal domain-containing protein [Methylocella sp.]